VAGFKTGYNIKIKNRYIIQPTFTYSIYKPDKNGYSIYQHKENWLWDTGINIYLNEQKLKISLHFTESKTKNYLNNFPLKSKYLGFGIQFIL